VIAQDVAPSALGLQGAGGPAGQAERAQTDRLLRQAAYFSLFSMPEASSPSEPIPLVPFIPALAIAFTVNEGLHRFEVSEPPPGPLCGFRVSKTIGKDYVAKVHMQMTPMPNYFEAAADRVPPPTLLLPFLSQRFCALDGSFEFQDAAGSGFRAFGTGRTFPAAQTRLAAVIDITEGYGALAGLAGTGIVNGFIQPPTGFAFSVLFRIVDPAGTLQAQAPLAPLDPAPDPVPDTVFMSFLAEPDPAQPLRAELAPGGTRLLVHISERLRLVELAFGIGPPKLRASAAAGEIVGRHRWTLVIDLGDGQQVLPAFSRGSVFTFFDRAGTELGTLTADLAEARVFPTAVAGLASPLLRIGGIAPPTAGSGQFKDPVGMISVNGAFSLATGASSVLYMVRLSDPLGVFQPVGG
jgi:hypothetical protein